MNTLGNMRRFSLENGLQLIINADRTVPKVSVQLWYNIGSKDELSGERGLAHLLEHMIFKGTKTLSESDINLITQKLSGYTNAFTSYDYTGYLFDFPAIHWQAALGMLADCMSNCTFDEDMLQSELKAVIQELKMYKDNYVSSLIETMTSAIFADHPYHNPVIGYKQDLWSITREGLLRFYNKYYNPQHATLVITGDVDPTQALESVRAYFGAIPGGQPVQKIAHPAQRDVKSTESILYRDLQRPLLMYAWRVPGVTSGDEFALNVIAHLIGQSSTSLLYQRLVDELALASDVGMMLDDLFEHGILFLQIDPINTEDISRIEAEVKKCITDLPSQVTDKKIQAAIKQVRMSYLVQAEQLQDRAYMIGKGFLATGDSMYVNKLIEPDEKAITESVKQLMQAYIRFSIMHKGAVLPLPACEQPFWRAVQEESDATDAVILSRKVRTSTIQPGRHVHTIEAQKLTQFNAPEPHEIILPNGLKVLFNDFGIGDKIELLLDFKTHYSHDPNDRQGLANFAFSLLEEGTTHMSKERLMQELAARGISFEIATGSIGMTLMKNDLLFGLNVLYDVLEHALFAPEAIEKVREQIFADIEAFWDEPGQIVKQLAREQIYQGHGYAKHPLGSKDSIAAITRQELLDYYRTHIRPHATLAVVGAIDEVTLKAYLTETLEKWQAVPPVDYSYSALAPFEPQEVLYPMVRDQIILAFVGRSVHFTDERYDALIIFDQFFSGGVTGSMSSRLFQLREQTGLFYTIGGSLAYGAGEQSGMFFVRTIVSQDRLAEAEAAIKRTMQEALVHVESTEFRAAKDALSYALIDQFATQRGIAQSFLFVDKLGLPKDFFSKRIEAIEKISLEQVLQTAGEIMDLEKLGTIKVGRV